MIHRLACLAAISVLSLQAGDAFCQALPDWPSASVYQTEWPPPESAHVVDVPFDLLEQGVDWDSAYSALASAPTPQVLRVPSGLPTDRLTRLLLVPAGVFVDALPDDPLVHSVVGFRDRHPAVADGTHERLVNSNYTFFRSLRSGSAEDRIVVVFGAAGRTTINVSRAFADDTLLQDAVTGATAFVSFGMARFEAHESGLMLIEEMP